MKITKWNWYPIDQSELLFIMLKNLYLVNWAKYYISIFVSINLLIRKNLQ